MEPSPYNIRQAPKKAEGAQQIFTFFTIVTFHPGKSFTDLMKHLNNKLGNLAKSEHRGKVWIILSAIIFGIGDAVIVWQADGWDAAKWFRDDQTSDIGTFSSGLAGPSDIW